MASRVRRKSSLVGLKMTKCRPAAWLAVNAYQDWSTFVQLSLTGLTRGALYALIALGYTLVYGILELINFGTGEVADPVQKAYLGID